MIPLAVTGYELSLFVHITAVMVGFGATFAESVMFPVALKMNARHLPYVHRLQLTINKHFALPALVLVLGTGIYQVLDTSAFDFGQLWIDGTLGIVVVLAVLLLAFFIPSDKKLLPMIEGEIAAAGEGEVTPSEEYQREARKQAIVGPVTGLLLVAAVYLMVTKPGL